MNKLTQELNKANDHIAFLSQITNENVEKYGLDFLKKHNIHNETDSASKFSSEDDILHNLNENR